MSEPPPFKCLLINKVDGSCATFNDSEQEDLQGFGVCLDPVHDVIWRLVLKVQFLDHLVGLCWCNVLCILCFLCPYCATHTDAFP